MFFEIKKQSQKKILSCEYDVFLYIERQKQDVSLQDEVLRGKSGRWRAGKECVKASHNRKGTYQDVGSRQGKTGTLTAEMDVYFQ